MAGKWGSMVSAVCLLGLCSCSDRPIEETSVTGQGSDPGYFVDGAYLEKFCVSTGLDYPIKTDERTIDGANPGSQDASTVRRFRATLSAILEVYPRRFFEEIGLRKIVLCQKLSVESIGCHAFSDVEQGLLFLNIDFQLPDLTIKRTIHHEVFHFLDYAEDHRLDEDRSWTVLNPIDFGYGGGGGTMQNDPDSTRLDDSLVGFLNRYSTSGLAEDKAEVYAYLMSDGLWIKGRAAADPILGRKVEQIRSTLRRFSRLSSGLLSAG